MLNDHDLAVSFAVVSQPRLKSLSFMIVADDPCRHEPLVIPDQTLVKDWGWFVNEANGMWSAAIVR